MKMEVKGHSGCQIDVTTEDDCIYVYKSTRDSKYLDRLVLQAEKQKKASEVAYQHIRVPKIFDIKKTDESVVVKMQYVYSKNFIEFFEQAGFEQIYYLIGAIEYFIEYEISNSKLESVSASVLQNKFSDIKSKCTKKTEFESDHKIREILSRSESVFANQNDMLIPIGICHGDLTFSNILFNGNNYYLIDFLDSFIETPLQDIVKIRQDTAYRWSQLMYTKRYDEVRLHIILDKIDSEIDNYFSNKYEWYRQCYHVMQLMNMLRILPYAHERKVIDYLKQTITGILDCIEKQSVNSGKHMTKEEKQVECSDKTNLLIPVAADKMEYANNLPYLFGLGNDGVNICVKSIIGLNLSQFDNIYFTVLKKHDEKFFVADYLNMQFRRLGINNAKVVVLDNPTQDQAETVYRTIQQEKISGSLFIKDADSYFETDTIKQNSVAIYPIEELETLAPKDKSYVAVDDMFYLTNIIEKSVVGHYISAGGYAISKAEDFCKYYNKLRSYGKLYLSHMIYAMLLDKKTFRPMIVHNYKDWGTINDYSRYE